MKEVKNAEQQASLKQNPVKEGSSQNNASQKPASAKQSQGVKVKPKIIPQVQAKVSQEASGFFALDEDFIPYTNHFNANTILTKNLQLLQTIKVNNFLNRELHHDVKHITLREAIRTAIKNNIKTDDFAFWIHTIRRKADLHEILTSENEYSKFFNEKWNEYHHFESQFINELYVTVLIKGVEIAGKDVAMKYFTDNKLKSFVNQNLEKKSEILTTAVDGMLKDLSNYSPKRLEVIEREGVLYSENIEFFHKILNMRDVEAELDEADISASLAISKMSLLSNKINLKSQFGSNSVAALTLKHYLETKPEILDSVLSLQFEFIIYQAFDFVNISEVADKYEHQYKMLRISKDKQMLAQLGLSEEEFGEGVTEDDRKMKYGENQIAIIVIGETEEKLEKEASQIVDVLSKTGFVVVRDDIMIEDTFFGSLPGNFFFLRRMQPIQTRKVAGFASIDNYPIGKIYNNLWGEAICIFRTKEKLPFFFNFHDDSGSGHTLFYGKTLDLQKNSIVNFLEIQSLKFKPRIINIDNDGNTKLLNAFVGGVYKRLSEEKSINTLNLNPFLLFSEKFALEDATIAFEKFLLFLLKFCGEEKDSNTKYLKEKILPFALKNKGSFRTMEDFANAIKNEKVISTFFKEVVQGGIFAQVFKSGEDDILNLKNDFLSIDIGDIYENISASKFFFEYLVEVLLLLTKDKKPTIIKIDHFLELCDFCKFSRKKTAGILKTFKENNVVLLMLEGYDFFQEYNANQEDIEIMEQIATQIFTPAFVNYDVMEEIKNSYLNKIIEFSKLSVHEKDVISSLSYDMEYFVLKHADKVVSLEFDPDFNPFLYFVLGSRDIEDEDLEGIKAANTMPEKEQELQNLFKQFFE